jgi:hypothetical protein
MISSVNILCCALLFDLCPMLWSIVPCFMICSLSCENDLNMNCSLSLFMNSSLFYEMLSIQWSAPYSVICTFSIIINQFHTLFYELFPILWNAPYFMNIHEYVPYLTIWCLFFLSVPYSAIFPMTCPPINDLPPNPLAVPYSRTFSLL